MGLDTPEPPPQHNDSVPVWELVIEDMKARDNAGRQKYGTPLQAFNGRKPLVDLYQELLDAVVYIRQEIEERRARHDSACVFGDAKIIAFNPDCPNCLKLVEALVASRR